MNDIIIGYSSNDFFWKSVGKNDYSIDSCNLQQCTSSTINIDNSFECYSKEICNNKQKSDLLKILQLNSGSDGRFSDTSKIFFTSILNTLNLGIGIFGIMTLILVYKK